MKLKFLGFALLTLLLFFSCDDTTDKIGWEILPSKDMVATYTTDFEVMSETVMADSVYARSLTAYLGRFSDPEFGYYDASFITELTTSENYLFPEVYKYDEATKTMVIYGKNDTDIKIPKTIHEATELDAQFDTFHLKVHLPFLRNGDTVLEEYIPAYLGRTNESLRFLRDYLKEHSNNEDLIKRAEKFVDLSITDIDDYTWSEQYDRIELKVGDYYWHREVARRAFSGSSWATPGMWAHASILTTRPST